MRKSLPSRVGTKNETLVEPTFNRTRDETKIAVIGKCSLSLIIFAGINSCRSLVGSVLAY